MWSWSVRVSSHASTAARIRSSRTIYVAGWPGTSSRPDVSRMGSAQGRRSGRVLPYDATAGRETVTLEPPCSLQPCRSRPRRALTELAPLTGRRWRHSRSAVPQLNDVVVWIQGTRCPPWFVPRQEAHRLRRPHGSRCPLGHRERLSVGYMASMAGLADSQTESGYQSMNTRLWATTSEEAFCSESTRTGATMTSPDSLPDGRAQPARRALSQAQR